MWPFNYLARKRNEKRLREQQLRFSQLCIEAETRLFSNLTFENKFGLSLLAVYRSPDSESKYVIRKGCEVYKFITLDSPAYIYEVDGKRFYVVKITECGDEAIVIFPNSRFKHCIIQEKDSLLKSYLRYRKSLADVVPYPMSPFVSIESLF